MNRLLSSFNEHLTANVEGKSLMVSTTTRKYGADINRMISIHGKIYTLIEEEVIISDRPKIRFGSAEVSDNH